MMAGQKARNFKGTLWRLLAYLKPFRLQLFAVIVAAMLSTVFMIVGPKLTGDAIIKLFEGSFAKLKGIPGAAIDFHGIAQILILIAGLYVLSSLFSYIQQYLMATVAQKTVYHLRQEVNEKLKKLPLKYYDGHPHGETLSRVTNDIDLIGTTLGAVVGHRLQTALKHEWILKSAWLFFMRLEESGSLQEGRFCDVKDTMAYFAGTSTCILHGCTPAKL